MSLRRELLALILTAMFAAVVFAGDANSFGKQYRSLFDYSIKSLIQIHVTA